jgi:hypothetical protein
MSSSVNKALRVIREQADEIERLRIELNATQDNEQRLVDANKPLLTRACAAEKEVERLRDALKEIDECLDGNWSRSEMKQIAREALKDG